MSLSASDPTIHCLFDDGSGPQSVGFVPVEGFWGAGEGTLVRPEAGFPAELGVSTAGCVGVSGPLVLGLDESSHPVVRSNTVKALAKTVRCMGRSLATVGWPGKRSVDLDRTRPTDPKKRFGEIRDT
jgi:hypothetical protein